MFGYPNPHLRQATPAEVWFRAQDDGISFGFSLEEWATLRSLFRRAWESPDIQIAWERLIGEYGEL